MRLFASLAAASFAVQPLLAKLAFDGGASIASVGTLRFALAAALLARARAAHPGRHSPARPAAAVRSRLDSLRARDRALLRLARSDRRLARFAPGVQLSGDRRCRGRAARPRTGVEEAGGGARRRARRRALALVGGVGGALDPIGIALALAAAVIYASYVLVSDRLLGTTEPLVLATMLCAGAATAFALGGAATGSLVVAQPSRTLLLIAAIALACNRAPDRSLPGRRAPAWPVPRDDPRHGRAAVDDRPLGGRLRRAADPGPAPRCGARGLGRRHRPGPGADEATAGSRHGAGTRAGARARAPRGLAPARRGLRKTLDFRSLRGSSLRAKVSAHER